MLNALSFSATVCAPGVAVAIANAASRTTTDFIGWSPFPFDADGAYSLRRAASLSRSENDLHLPAGIPGPDPDRRNTACRQDVDRGGGMIDILWRTSELTTPTPAG